ncbi:MAG TPA: hypothetical protein VGN83_28280 [Falsiroseomonas sp.]|jgi:hypothetical protein|nr:hypothetical protein [Falsiroseomonas sp.]
MKKVLGATILGAAVIAAGAIAPGSASAQQTWTYGYDRGAMDQPGGRDWGQGRNYQANRDRTVFNRGYQMGRDEERRVGQRGYYGRDYGYGTGMYDRGAFDQPRGRDWGTGGGVGNYGGGLYGRNYGYNPGFGTGYGYGGGYGTNRGYGYGYGERDEGWFGGGEDDGWF